VRRMIPFKRMLDSAGYSVTSGMLGDGFTRLALCTFSTTQVFFPDGLALEIPTETLGRALSCSC
jgi:hypothetical protein